MSQSPIPALQSQFVHRSGISPRVAHRRRRLAGVWSVTCPVFGRLVKVFHRGNPRSNHRTTPQNRGHAPRNPITVVRTTTLIQELLRLWAHDPTAGGRGRRQGLPALRAAGLACVTNGRACLRHERQGLPTSRTAGLAYVTNGRACLRHERQPRWEAVLGKLRHESLPEARSRTAKPIDKPPVEYPVCTSHPC